MLDVQVLPNIPFDEYAAIPAINASILKGIGQYSPKHLKACLDREIADSDSVDRRLGRAIHCMMLEPERFATDFPLAESTCEATVKASKGAKKRCDSAPTYRLRTGEWRCGTHKNLTETAINPETQKEEDLIVEVAQKAANYVTADEQRRIKKLNMSVMGEPAGQLFLCAEVETELTVVWTQFGFRLKVRIDYASLQPRRIVELKKMLVGKGRDEDLKHESGKRGYHIQAWFQIAAYTAAFDKMEFDAADPGKRPEMWFLFSEDSPPFCANALPVNDIDLQIAQIQIKAALETFARCQQSGKYHGYQVVLDPEKSGITTDYFRKPFMDEIDPEPQITFGGESL